MLVTVFWLACWSALVYLLARVWYEVSPASFQRVVLDKLFPPHQP